MIRGSDRFVLTNPQSFTPAELAGGPTAEECAARDERITELVHEQLDLEPGTLGEQDPFVDHGADSLGLFGVLSALEQEFGVTIEPADLERMDCLAGVREVLAELAEW
jgi:acyl carrier protein